MNDRPITIILTKEKNFFLWCVWLRKYNFNQKVFFNFMTFDKTIGCKRQICEKIIFNLKKKSNFLLNKRLYFFICSWQTKERSWLAFSNYTYKLKYLCSLCNKSKGNQWQKKKGRTLCRGESLHWKVILAQPRCKSTQLIALHGLHSESLNLCSRR